MRLLILGTGGMARAHAENFGAIKGVKIVGGVDTNPDNLEAFCDRFDIAHSFNSLKEAIEWGRFDAVANVTPDSAHYTTTMECLAAEKHVFCEKPLATDYQKALEMTEMAEKAGLVGMVNLTYRNVAEIHKMRAMVHKGKIGEVKHIEASYLQSWLNQPAWGQWDTEHQWLWRLSSAHGSNGVLGDIGIHIVDFATFGAACDLSEIFCRLQTFAKAPNDRVGEYVLDANDSFAMSVGFKNGAIGVVHASRWAAGHMNELRLRIHGDKGGIEVMHNMDGSTMRACLGKDMEKRKWRKIKVKPVKTTYERFALAVAAGKPDEPSFRRAAMVQKILDLSVVSNREGVDKSL